MKTTNKFVDNNLLLKYNRAIYNFEKYIEDLYTKIKTVEMKCGYLINLNDYEDLKKKIKYRKEEAKKYLQKEIKVSNSEKIYIIKEIESRAPEYLIDMINKGNKYIMVDQNFWRIFCEIGKENKDPIFYYISSQNEFYFTLNKVKINFISTRNNIICKNSYKNDNKEQQSIKERTKMFSNNNNSNNNNINNKISTNNNNNCNNNNKNIQSNKKDPLFQFLENIIVIRNSKLDLQNKIKQFHFFGNKEKNIIIEYILINKNYMDKFELLMNFKEINEIIINKKMTTTSDINQKINELKVLIKDKPFVKNIENISIHYKFDCIYDLYKKEKGKEKEIPLLKV